MKLNILFLTTLSVLLAFGSTTEKNNSATAINIMSFNLRYANGNDGAYHWDYRKQACVDMINDQKPDVFGIQEGLINQVEFLDSALTNYTWIGVGRDSAELGNEYSAVFFLKEEYELINQSTFWLSETPEIESKGWDARLNRIATWVHLRKKADDKEFIVLNAHLDHIGVKAQEESIKLIVAKLKELSKDSITTFAIGDFNVRDNNPILTPMYTYMACARKESKVTDMLGTFNGFGKEIQENKIIDFIFYRNTQPILFQTIVKSYNVPYISDHYPISCRFEY